MKSPTLSLLLFFLPFSLLAAEQITVEAKFIESPKTPLPHDIQKLNKQKGADLLSAPRVTTKPGQEAQIEIVREHQPASLAPSSFPPVPLGITVRVTPDIKDGKIVYRAQLTVRQLVTTRTQGKQTSSEIVSRDLYVSGQPKDGEAVWFDFTEPHQGKRTVVWLRFQRAAA